MTSRPADPAEVRGILKMLARLAAALAQKPLNAKPVKVPVGRADTRPYERRSRARQEARRPHGPPPALTRHQREEALRDLAKGKATQADLAQRFNVSRSTISRPGDADDMV